MRRDWIERYQPMLQQDPPSGGAGEPEPEDNNAHGGGHEQPETPGQQEQQQPEQPAISFKSEADFMKRLKRESRSQLDQQAQELGYENHQAMLDAAKAVKEQEAQQQTELDKLKAKAETAEQQRDAALRTANDRLIKAEVKMLASDSEISIVPEAIDDAYLLMAKDDIEVADDGSVSGVREALKSLVEAKPWLRVSDQQPRPVPGSPRPAGQQSRQELIAAETDRLRRSGQYGI